MAKKLNSSYWNRTLKTVKDIPSLGLRKGDIIRVNSYKRTFYKEDEPGNVKVLNVNPNNKELFAEIFTQKFKTNQHVVFNNECNGAKIGCYVEDFDEIHRTYQLTAVMDGQTYCNVPENCLENKAAAFMWINEKGQICVRKC